MCGLPSTMQAAQVKLVVKRNLTILDLHNEHAEKYVYVNYQPSRTGILRRSWGTLEIKTISMLHFRQRTMLTKTKSAVCNYGAVRSPPGRSHYCKQSETQHKTRRMLWRRENFVPLSKTTRAVDTTRYDCPLSYPTMKSLLFRFLTACNETKNICRLFRRISLFHLIFRALLPWYRDLIPWFSKSGIADPGPWQLGPL